MRFLALFLARNREFYRDKGSVSWAFLLPILIVVVVGAAFSGEDQELFKLGVFGAEGELPRWSVADEPHIAKTYFAADEPRAFRRLRQHQLDFLVSADEPLRYWVNEQSPGSRTLESLLLAERPDARRSALEGRKLRYIDWAMPGILAMNMMFAALFGAGYVVVRYRKNGVLKRLQATPVNSLEFLAAQIMSRLLIILSASVMLFVGGRLLLDFMMLGNHLLLFALFALGGVSLIALGLLCSSRTESEELAGGLLNLLTFPMMLLSEVWFSLEDAPRWMQLLSQALPLTHLVHAGREIMLEGAGVAEIFPHLLTLTLMTLAALLLAAVLFRWQKP